MSLVSSSELERYRTKRGRRLASRIIDAGGFSDIVASFGTSLNDVRKKPDVVMIIDGYGRHLWERSVESAQVDTTVVGNLPGNDDRPLYWARLAMMDVLYTTASRLRVDDDIAVTWRTRLEWASRGVLSTTFGEEQDGVKKVLISGFDPFRLRTEPRASNPSGSIALWLHGRTLTVNDVPIRFASVVLPVRYADFDAGLIERVFRPHLVPGPHQVDLAVSLSQGRVGQFDIELFNGLRRCPGATRDNDEVLIDTTAIEAPAAVDTVDSPEFVRSTLPFEAMATVVGEFPVVVNTRVTEIPPGADNPVISESGPTKNSRAVLGSGGGFLSNEIGYRITALRDAVNVSLPVGHLHTPQLDVTFTSAESLSEPVLESGRDALVAQATRLLSAAILSEKADR